eukprot:TRINITY_DN2387_c0_g2_i2.p2 TRINITY_DN2387_c0_g2~~TRINITY_DN2387_c0_g2_i2.p2  ORF type:complete len:264 (+),score=-19.50 TRINITY_DN2387_c0_g2_i2:246-1037(+)
MPSMFQDVMGDLGATHIAFHHRDRQVRQTLNYIALFMKYKQQLKFKHCQKIVHNIHFVYRQHTIAIMQHSQQCDFYIQLLKFNNNQKRLILEPQKNRAAIRNSHPNQYKITLNNTSLIYQYTTLKIKQSLQDMNQLLKQTYIYLNIRIIFTLKSGSSQQTTCCQKTQTEHKTQKDRKVRTESTLQLSQAQNKFKSKKQKFTILESFCEVFEKDQKNISLQNVKIFQNQKQILSKFYSRQNFAAEFTCKNWKNFPCKTSQQPLK